jgi:hypothetical protein
MMNYCHSNTAPGAAIHTIHVGSFPLVFITAHMVLRQEFIGKQDITHPTTEHLPIVIVIILGARSTKNA